MLKTGKFRLNSRRRLSAARGVMRCESHSPTTRPWGTSVPETPPHTQPFIPFFSKDNSLKLLNYRTYPKTLLKLDCSDENKLSFCTGNPWIQRDSVRGTFPLLLQLLHRDHISRFTGPCQYHSSVSYLWTKALRVSKAHLLPLHLPSTHSRLWTFLSVLASTLAMDFMYHHNSKLRLLGKEKSSLKVMLL